MKIRQFLVLCASVLATSLPRLVVAQETQGQYVRVAQIEIDPTQLDAYKAAITEHIEAAVQVEPGVLVLYAVSDKDSPTHVTVFEIYRDADAYKAHLESSHFRKYKLSTEQMVTSLKLVRSTPILLRAK